MRASIGYFAVDDETHRPRDHLRKRPRTDVRRGVSSPTIRPMNRLPRSTCVSPRHGVLALFVWLCAVAPAAAQSRGPDVAARSDDTMQHLVDDLAAHHRGKVSLYAKDLRTGQTVAINPDTPVNTASVIKLAIMLEAMYEIKDGKLSFDDTLTLRKEDQVSGSGVLLLFHTPRPSTSKPPSSS